VTAVRPQGAIGCQSSREPHESVAAGRWRNSPDAGPEIGVTQSSVPESTLAVVSYSTLSAIAVLLGSIELLPALPMSDPEQAELYDEITERMASLAVLLDRFVFFPEGTPES
jgi:hypothetical protein